MIPALVTFPTLGRSNEEGEMAKNLATWERGMSIGAGGALLWFAARHEKGRAPAAAAGASLLVRGVSGYCPISAAMGRDAFDTRVALGGPRGIRVRESVTIVRPVEELYGLWRDLSKLPELLPHIERIDLLPEGRSHWVVRGPAGLRLEWDAETINDIPNELIAWRSVEGADVVSAGSVRFTPVRRGGVEVRVHLQYAPPAGKAGMWAATLLGANPARQIREDLRRLKQTLEAGGAPRAHAERDAHCEEPVGQGAS
jgi:uncharacterized membrane protein